jgi:hypothetical protein
MPLENVKSSFFVDMTILLFFALTSSLSNNKVVQLIDVPVHPRDSKRGFVSIEERVGNIRLSLQTFVLGPGRRVNYLPYICDAKLDRSGSTKKEESL